MTISTNVIPISEIFAVIRNNIPPRKKKSYMDCRECDGFIYITKGWCSYDFDDYSFDVRAGDILYLSEGAHYSMDTHEELYEFIYCNFSFLSEAPRKSAVYTAKNPIEAERCFARLYTAFATRDTAAAFSYLYRIYAMITDTERTYIARSARDKVRSARDKIDVEYSNPDLSVESLAQTASISTVYFRKLFFSVYSETPQSYITSVRIDAAKRLLTDPFITLEECARRTGFSTKQYFSRVFKEKTSKSPGEYRRGKNKTI